MNPTTLFNVLFGCAVTVLLAIDLLSNRKAHRISLKEAALWTTIWVSCALLFGLGVGWVQQLRGAHFLTHTLWSGWIACALVLLNYSLAKRQPIRYSSVPRNDAQAA